MELKDFKDVVRVMTKEEFESTIEEDIKFVEGFKNFLKHDDATRIVDHITFKGNGKESFSFNRVLVENLIETFETMQDIYSDNYRLKVYTGNCIIQLNANPKDPSESFF